MVNRTVALMLAMVAVAAAQQSAPVQKSTQSPRTGVTARKTPVADDAMLRGEAALDKEDYVAAEAALQEAIKSNPENFRAWYDLGYVYRATNRLPQAIEAYRKSIAAKPDIFESNLNLGLLLAQSGDASAEKYLRFALTLKPTSNTSQNLARAWLGLAQIWRKSDPQKAREAYARVAQLQPTDPEPHLSSALLAENANDFAAAEKEYETAARLDPKSLEAAAGLANVYMETKHPEAAVQALRKYLALLGDDPGTVAANPLPARSAAAAHTQLARVLLQLHRRDEAIAELEAALKLSPGSTNAQQQLAWLYLDDKQYANAEAQFRSLLQASPKDADLHHGLGSSLLQQKKFDEAQKELIAAVQLKPGLADAYGELAAAASENKDYVLTLKALAARAKLLPDNPGTLFLRATSLDHLGDRVNASNSYREFLAVSNGKFPDQEWQARHRLIAIDPKAKK